MKKLFILLSLFTINKYSFSQAPPVTIGLNLHLENAASNFTETDGASTLSRWEDLSGSGNHMVGINIARSPILNSALNGVQFNGLEAVAANRDMMQNETLNATFSNPNGTIFIVRVANTAGTINGGANWRTLMTISENDVFNNEFGIYGNWAIHHNSTGLWSRRTHQCYNSLPDSLPVLQSSSFGTAPNDINYYVNGILATEGIVQSGTPFDLGTVNRRIYLGGRMSAMGAPFEFFTGTVLEVLAYNRVLTEDEMELVNDHLKCKYNINYSELMCNTPLDCPPPTSCNDSCYWRLDGNNIIDGNNIFGTNSSDDVRIHTSGMYRGIFTSNGLLGWNTDKPTAYLHVNCEGHNEGEELSDIRFENLEKSQKGTILIIREDGYVFDSKIPITNPGDENHCSITNILPKTINPDGTMSCSQVFDNGNSVGIGTTSGFGYTWSGGLTGATLPPTSGTLRLAVNGVTRSLAYIATSDEKFKTNIKSIQDPSGIINGLEGKTYNWNAATIQNTGADNGLQYGFIAQEVSKVMPEAVVIDEEGNYGINYDAFIPVLVENQKEILAQLEAEKEKNKVLERELEHIQLSLSEIEVKLALLQNCCNTVDSRTEIVVPNNGSYLKQNDPNPFTGNTNIEYFVHSLQSYAYIGIFDLNGKEIKKIPIQSVGIGQYLLQGSDFNNGMYLYSLIVDGQVIDTKKMVVAR